MKLNLKLISYTAKRLTQHSKKQRFLNFSRLVAFLSVMIGSMALIISLSVLGGFETELRQKAVQFTSHITINTFNRNPIKQYTEIASILKKDFNQVKDIAPVVQREGLIRTKSFIEGIMIKGYKKEYDITGLNKYLKQGSLAFCSDSSKEIIIGNRLAKKLNVSIGENVVLYSLLQDSIGNMTYPEIEKMKVIGIYETGMAMYDDIMVYIPFSRAENFFKLPDNSVNSFEIIVRDIQKIKETASQIESYMGYPFYCNTVYELHSSIFAWIDLQKEPIPIVLGLISIVAVLNIITILLIVVVEKTHTIGILRALGMNKLNIVSIFIFQGVSIGLLGAMTGSVIGLLFCFIQQNFGIIQLQGDVYFLDVLPINISVWHYEIVIGVSILMSFLATLIPSLIAIKITPIRAIRFK